MLITLYSYKDGCRHIFMMTRHLLFGAWAGRVHAVLFVFKKDPLFFFFFVVQEYELSPSCLLGSTLPLEPLRQSFSVLGFFKIGSHELFACAGFKLKSS
jgi:hypothetical protein